MTVYYASELMVGRPKSPKCPSPSFPQNHRLAVMSQTAIKDDERGVTAAADEVELARMGYKQELKFVHLSHGNVVG